MKKHEMAIIEAYTGQKMLTDRKYYISYVSEKMGYPVEEKDLVTLSGEIKARSEQDFKDLCFKCDTDDRLTIGDEIALFHRGYTGCKGDVPYVPYDDL